MQKLERNPALEEGVVGFPDSTVTTGSDFPGELIVRDCSGSHNGVRQRTRQFANDFQFWIGAAPDYHNR